MTRTDDLPLLDRRGLPRFDAITPDQVEPGIRLVLDDLERELDQLERSVQPTWPGLVEPLTRIGEPLRHAWGAVGHLMGVRNCPELRAAHQAVQPDVVRVVTRMGQSEPLYRAALGLRDGPEWAALDEAQQRVVTAMIRDAELSGVALAGDARAKFNATQRELAELSTAFSNAVLDATKAFALKLTEPGDVEGLPDSLRDLAAQNARDAGDAAATPAAGPWRITLDAPCLGPFLQHCRRRGLRETLYRAFVRRASEGEFDNTARIDRILELRRERADLLGFRSYAEQSLHSKMAGSVQEVRDLLEDLRARSFAAAEQDLEDARSFAQQAGAIEGDDFRHWDVPFWVERLRERRFAFNDEMLRPYFPLPTVLDGLFGLAHRLFGVTIRSADGEAPLWHRDVRFFRIHDEAGEPLAAFYLDPYSRPAEKRGGAWMDECVTRSRLFAPAGSAARLPIAHLVCNGTPPVGDKPSLMTFREVETLFHEFGHGLQHMLTTVDYDGAAGINGIEWDAVELPSQFMENWCYHRPTLLSTSRHYLTGEPLPDELFDKISAARTFRVGSDMLRQLYFALTDLALHHDYVPDRDGSPFDVQRRVAATTTVMEPLAEDRFLCSFSHVFAGGYAAGYYSYKWSEVLSADAFGAFEEAGLDDEDAVRATGRRFRDTVLALGGGRHPMEVFRAFRGRGPSTDALLRHAGLA